MQLNEICVTLFIIIYYPCLKRQEGGERQQIPPSPLIQETLGSQEAVPTCGHCLQAGFASSSEAYHLDTRA